MKHDRRKDYYADITYIEPIEIEILPAIFSRSGDYQRVSRVFFHASKMNTLTCMRR